MLEEEINMEKKGFTRQTSVPPPKNGPSAESKKNDNSNKFPRNTRKRESQANGRGGSDNNGSRKPVPQKWRSSGDKRPRSRTFNPFDRQREEVAGYGDDSGNYRSKKGNLNHLLNFSFAPREVDTFSGGSVRKTKTGNRVRFDKKRFLQANCQFIVQDTGDYTVHSADPDILVDWDLIELVRLYTFEKPLCPICLDSPVAAKVTRCGHIYCWSCILHLLSLEDGTWAECPICYSPVVDKDLRSAEPIIVKPYKVGDKITMKLMKREAGSTYSLPVDSWLNRHGKPHSINDDESITRYMKILTASPSDILSRVICREKTSLETQLLVTEVSEICFIETAQAQLKERESILQVKADVEKNFNKVYSKNSEGNANISTSFISDDNISSRTKTVSIGSTTSLQSDEYPVISAGRFKTFSESSLSDTDHLTTDINHDSSDCDPSTMPKSQSVPLAMAEGVCSLVLPEESVTEPEMSTDESKKMFQKPKNKQVYSSKNGYFCFQAKDGQQIYIHNINSRCLTHEYGSLELSPKEITGNIIDIRSLSMTEELRARTKYLNHLPLASEFLLVELALRPPILSRQTLDLFQGEIDQKRRFRQRKANTERQREKKIVLEENKKLGIFPGLNISLESEYQFPSYMNQPEQVSRGQPSSPPGNNDVQTSPVDISDLSLYEDNSPPMSSPEDNNSSSVSFAQMLRQGPAKAQQPIWPKPVNKVESFPALGASRGAAAAGGGDSDGSDMEDYVPVPEYGRSFGNAIQAALDNAAAAKTATKTPKQKGGGSGGKNKKKSKKTKVLFSTSMTRGTID
ncbi:RING finger protein 10 [Patella vulgata]|uniref:RING finger protein 10 n=1 Tax=Patella vulgata TaxID=6465 RepID=UPI0024A9E044|nr:RING finger protein 10 [Patella vulgata]